MNKLAEYKELLARTSEKPFGVEVLREFLESEVYRALIDTLDMRVLLRREDYDKCGDMDEVARIQGAIDELMFLKALFPAWLENEETDNV